MTDDIVIGNVTYRRVSGKWTMTPSPTSGMFHIDPRRRELLDEIERLRSERDAERALANQLAEALDRHGSHSLCTMLCSVCVTLAAHQEARRER